MVDRWLNRAAPGAGLILQGRYTTGILLGLLFTLFLSIALAGWLLTPDDIPPWTRFMALGGAGGAYFLAQFVHGRVLRWRHEFHQQERRRRVLREADEALRRGAPREALEALALVPEALEHDLALAVRQANALTELDERAAAHAAWQRVRRLDPHGVYRAEADAAEGSLRDGFRGRLIGPDQE